nr:hypothetical protein [Motilibacter deserti]
MSDGRGREARRLSRLVTVLGGVTFALLPAPAGAADSPGGFSPVVVLGAGGLRWSDVSPEATPTLWELAGEGAVGSLVTRTARPVTCPADGWLTVGAGTRAQAVEHGGPGGSKETCPASGPAVTPDGEGARVQEWAAIGRLDANERFDTRPGLLAEAAAQAPGTCVTAIGPGAALAAADPAGRVAYYAPSVADATSADVTRCQVTMVELGDIDARAGDRAAQVAAVDAAAARVRELRQGPATWIVLGLSGDASGETHLGLAVRHSDLAPTAPSWLDSSSTRRQAVVQLTDVTPTVLGLVGAPVPDEAVGSPLEAGAPVDGLGEAVDDLVAADDAERVVRGTQSWFWITLLGLQLVVYLLATLVLRRSWGPARRRVLTWTRWGALASGAVPAATFLADLVPWWRAGAPVPAIVALVAALTVAIGALAAAGPWRGRPLGPPTAVAAVTALVLGLDVLLGARLQLGSLMGYFPTVAGRFYGFGNQAFSLFATGALFAAGGLAAWLLGRGPGRRGLATAAVVLVGVATLGIDGAPSLGADVGGVLAILPGFAVLALLVSGRRVSVVRLAAALGAAVLLLAVVGLADAARPATSRTHLGRFVIEVRDGEAGGTIARKLGANLGLLTSTPLTLLLPAAIVFVVLVLRRPARWHAPALQRAYEREPLLRPTLAALLVLQAVAFAVNDSGVAIPAVSLMLVIPFLLAASVHALELDEAGARPAPAARPRPATPATEPRPAAP